MRCPSLVLMVYPSGRKAFVFYRKVEGRPEQVTLGRFPEMTIEQARGRAEELNARVAQGGNPGADARRIREEMTFSELFERYLELHARVHKKSWKGDQDQFDRYLAAWKNRKLRTIRKADVQALHAQVAQPGNRTG